MRHLKLLAAALAASTIAGSAFAADLPSRKAPPVVYAPAPIFTWTGLYVGLNAGYTWSGKNDISVLTTDTGVGGFTGAQVNGVLPWAVSGAKNDGFIGGGQIGYNWQTGSIVFGLEADIQGVAGAKSNQGLFLTAPAFQPVASSYHRSLDLFGTVRGRVGFTVTPTFLLYATGGLAYGQTKLGFSAFGPTWGPPMAVATSVSKMSVGWTVGAGAEYAFSPNWSAKVEYLYYDLGRLTTPAAAYVYGGNLTTVSTSVRNTGHIVRAGVNYKFGWGAPAPVVARY